MMRFSAVTTIRGRNVARVNEAVRQKQAEVASLPHVVSFKTTIPRTGEQLRIFLTDEDALSFEAIRLEHSPLRDRLVENMDARQNPRREIAESGLNQMVNEGALLQFLQQYPERDVSGELHERIDCKSYWLKPGTMLGRAADWVRGLFASSPSLPSGQFDFSRDLKNPIHAFSLDDDDL